MDTFIKVTPALAVLVATVVAALTLRHLLVFRAGRRTVSPAARLPDPAPEAPPTGHRPRYRVQPVLIVLTLLCSTILATGAGDVDDTVHAGVRAIFRTAMARPLGNVDEIVTTRASRMGRATPNGAYAIRPYFFPAAMADRLRTGLASGHTAGVAGAIVLPVAFHDQATHRTAAHVALLGAPAGYSTAFGPLVTAAQTSGAVRGGRVTLGQLEVNQVYINQAAAQALGARAGDRLQLLIGGRPVPTGPTTLYFAEGDTGQARTKGQATFEETLVIHNTTPFPATATLTYLIEGATPLLVTRVIPPHATLRESVNRDVGPNRSVAAIVTSPSRLTAQRLLRRLDASGAALGARSVPGIPAAGTTLSFAPIDTQRSDVVYVALANPGTVAARVNAMVTQRPGSWAGASTQSVTVPARGRATLGLAHPAGSLRVTSDQPIVAEEVHYSGAGQGPAKRGWTVAAGVLDAPSAASTRRGATAGTTAASFYAPVVRAVLRNQNLAAGGLLSGGADAIRPYADPMVLLPLAGLQQVTGQPGQITAVLISNRGDALAGAPLTGQVTSALRALLVSTDGVTAVKLLLILPHGQDALQALQQDRHLAAGTRAKLRGVQAELAVPGTSERLKSLLSDPAVSAALRTVTDPAVADPLQPALAALSAYTVQPVKQAGLMQADAAASAVAARFAARFRPWGRIALAVGILLSVLLVALLPVGDPLSARAGRRAAGGGHLSPPGGDAGVRPIVVAGYACDLGATLAGVMLGSAVASRVVTLLATRDAGNLGSAVGFALHVQDSARSVGVALGLGELVLVLAVAVASRRLSRRNSVTASGAVPVPVDRRDESIGTSSAD